MKKKIEKDSDNFWYRKLTLKVKRLCDFALFDTSPTVEDDNSFSLPKKRSIFSSRFQYSERTIHSTERNFTSAESS